MGRKVVSEEPEKVHRLSLAELAAHDDACSDAMVDNAYFKSQIRKNRTKYNPLRGIKEDEVPQILLHKLIVGKDPAAAEKSLLQLSGLKRYRNGLRSKSEQENFLKHLRKYIFMYMTDCPWEVSTTNRYTITTYEAAVTARQRVKEGQVIKYLVGTLVPLTTEESADLDLTNRNFSIVVSSRKKNSSIFLGPARFANHDCDANGRLVTRGNDGMDVVAVKNIEVGDEITVSYGDDYFGPENIDCLCHTCERLVRNGWAGARDISDSQRNSMLSSQEPATPEPQKGKRKRAAELLTSDRTLSRLSKLPRLKPSPSKLQQSWTPPTSTDDDAARSAEDGFLAATRLTRRSLRGPEKDDLAPSPPFSPSLSNGIASTPQTVTTHTKSALRRTSANMISSSEPKSSKMATRILGNLSNTKQCPTPQSDIDTEYDANTITIKVETIETSKIETDSSAISLDENRGIPSPEDDPDSEQAQAISTLTTTEVTKITKLPMDDTAQVIPSIEPPAITTTTISKSVKLTVQPLSDHVRLPGDYLLTRKLLAQPHDRWVQCHNDRCQDFFIQPNGYQTRRECPRCERHSMLYGFSWPKTDPDPRKVLERKSSAPGGQRGRKPKTPGGANERSAYRRSGKCGKGNWIEGGGDEEERVMDHRTVHRFVLPEDEKAVTRKGLLKMAEIARSKGEDAELAERVGGRRTDSVDLDSDRAGSTPDGEARRRSRRFVTRVGVYADN